MPVACTVVGCFGAEVLRDNKHYHPASDDVFDKGIAWIAPLHPEDEEPEPVAWV